VERARIAGWLCGRLSGVPRSAPPLGRARAGPGPPGRWLSGGGFDWSVVDGAKRGQSAWSGGAGGPVRAETPFCPVRPPKGGSRRSTPPRARSHAGVGPRGNMAGVRVGPVTRGRRLEPRKLVGCPGFFSRMAERSRETARGYGAVAIDSRAAGFWRRRSPEKVGGRQEPLPMFP